MKKSIAIIILTMFLTLISKGQDLEKDRDYQNFARNYKREVKAFSNKVSCQTPRCFSNIERYTKYSQRFLKKLKKKYGSERFSRESNKLSEIETHLTKKGVPGQRKI